LKNVYAALAAAAIVVAALVALNPMQQPGEPGEKAVPRKPEDLITGVSAKLSLTSTAFRDGEHIPRKYTCSGDDVSPPLQWSQPPPGTKSLVLIMYDPDAPRGIFYHWILYNIPPDTRGLPENIAKKPETEHGQQGRNSFGRTGYGGPCPPLGSTHHYVFLLLALDTRLSLPANATPAQVMQACQGHVKAYAKLTGLYRR